MKNRTKLGVSCGFLAAVGLFYQAKAETKEAFRGAPASASALKNPNQERDAKAIREGARLFSDTCASCHGKDAMGSGNVPALLSSRVQSASEGELFWFIGAGSPDNGMPPSKLSKESRWKVVTFLKSLKSKPVEEKASPTKDDIGPSPKAPFTDYRFEGPGIFHKISVKDLPSPLPDTSVGNAPDVVPRPKDAWPKVPPGFKVDLYVSGLDNPRLIRTAPNGDLFLAESESGRIRVFRGLSADGKPVQKEVFATDLDRPYGIAFYPPGNDPHWIYIGTTPAVVRFPYKSGDLHATGGAEKIASLPGSGGHWTRDLQFSRDGSKLFVGVGSASNVDDPDTTLKEKNRADILSMNPDGSSPKVYAYGIRNAGGGLAINPTTGELWCSVNERDGLGDNLVPDYITHVVEGGYYGWPWWYIGGNQDPRHLGKHPELQQKLITPDVLLQPHHASLELAFYDGKQFPAEYSGDLFSSQHGSWNRSVRTGYELIRVPLHQKQKATGEYEDFMTGFVVDSGHVWGRPVGVTVAQDGSLLVTDDASNSIWRITYTGK
jgi:glucose/arabinose dehydrogenase/mono/diheme cytochrome c family protein